MCGGRGGWGGAAARRRCPELVFVSPRFEAYRAVSAQIRAIFESCTPHVEPLSLDEAYLDVTDAAPAHGGATAIAKAIRARIREDTGLTASAGVSYNKFLAKLASDHHKPDGLCVITPAKGPAFVASIPVSRFHGVGPVTAAKMKRLGIETGADLLARSLPWLECHFGSSAPYYFDLARAVCHRPVRAHRERKSLGAEDTFGEDYRTEADLLPQLHRIAGIVWERAAPRGVRGRTVTLKIKYADFTLNTRARTLPAPVRDQDELFAVGAALLRAELPPPRGIRLLGLTLSKLGDDAELAEPIAPELPLL